MRVLIENGKLLDPSNKLDQTQNLFIADNKIVSLIEYLDTQMLSEMLSE